MSNTVCDMGLLITSTLGPVLLQVQSLQRDCPVEIPLSHLPTVSAEREEQPGCNRLHIVQILDMECWRAERTISERAVSRTMERVGD